MATTGRFRHLAKEALARLDAARARRTAGAESSPAPAGDGTYDGRYFGLGRNPFDRMGLSGYATYGRDTSNADIAAYLLWRFFPVDRSLDVGCALGFVVEALREVGIEAEGVDVSQWAVDHAAPGAVGHIRRGDLVEGIDVPDASFPLVTALETLEHLPPDAVPGAIASLRRVTSGWVVVTIPSFGINDHGPHGFPNSKVRDDRLDHYIALGTNFEGPIPQDDLMRDADGEPIEGHLTIASYRWWTARFAEAGLERCGEMERRIHPQLARFGLTEFWNLYVFRVPGTPLPPGPVRDADALIERERMWRLSDRHAPERALMFLREGLGDEAVAEAQRPAPGI
ncbi:MAG: class I SAM-dependent methyltransferase [Acidimicrobiia bacterium]